MGIPTGVKYYEDASYNALFISVMNSMAGTGVFNEAALPDSVKERLTTVADTTALYALTATNVQNGDIVKVGDSDFYVVIDNTKLDSSAGYVLLGVANSATATKLATARTINDVSFDGSANINAPCFAVGTTAPTNTSFLWVDTTAAPNVIKYYDGEAWTAVVTSA